MNKYKIVDRRLEAATSYGRIGKKVADIGTDHASLPIYLVGNGIAPSALACDINAGPLNAAYSNIFDAGLADKIKTVLTDGLNGIENYHPEDIYILGMGGELIWRIISSSTLPRVRGVRLILQPMTHGHDLRKGLYDNGFDILDETLVTDRDRVYHIIVAEYDGIARTYTEIELWLGKHNMLRGGEELKNISAVYASAIEKKIRGYAEAGKTDIDAIALYNQFKKVSEDDG